MRSSFFAPTCALSACADEPLRGGFGPDDATARDAVSADVPRDDGAYDAITADDAVGCPGDDAAVCAARPLGCEARER